MSSRSNLDLELEDLLSRQKTAILTRWFDLILAGYPSDTRRFLKKQKDPFANPVGTTIQNAIEALYEELLEGKGPEKLSTFLDHMIRIRAVQDFSPSQAIEFIFQLKAVIRERLEGAIQQQRLFQDLLSLESKIDRLALLSFDIYMQCRERIYEIRVHEVKNRTSRLLERADLVYKMPQKESDPLNSHSDVHE